MADDKADLGRRDQDRINITEVYELRYWSNKFGVSKEELAAAGNGHVRRDIGVPFWLAAAVARVGPIAKDVEAELKKAPRANG